MASYCSVSLDVAYGGRAMDLLTPAGMGFPCSAECASFCKDCQKTIIYYRWVIICLRRGTSTWDQHRLALLTLLKLEPNSMGLLAPVCSTMGFLASSVTQRTFMLPLGDISKMTVQQGNLLAIRCLASVNHYESVPYLPHSPSKK